MTPPRRHRRRGPIADFVPHRPARPEKSEGGKRFKLVSEYEPAGDQPTAIKELVEQARANERDQVLLGVTGSGKTFTMAKVIETLQRPALILAPNKTLAAQLYSEFKQFFPENAVEYFVSYYDYYQPEAYIPRTDTYIEKDSSINEEIDRMRHSATRAILERDDVIIVASVSCIYGIGSVETYSGTALTIKRGARYDRMDLMRQLSALQYRRNDDNFVRGAFRVRGDTIDIFPAHYEDRAWRIELFGDEVDSITEFDPLTGKKAGVLDADQGLCQFALRDAAPDAAAGDQGHQGRAGAAAGTVPRRGQIAGGPAPRTAHDLRPGDDRGDGHRCAGIENYSRWLTGRKPGEPPPTMFEYLPDEALVFADESHVTVPQIGAMYRGDYRRKFTLSEYGFRLPSCIDNRPLKFEEWDAMRPQTVYVSATPGPWEMERTGGRVLRTGDPPHRADRSAGRNPPRRNAGRRSDRRMPRGGAAGLSHAGHDADQEDGRGPDRIHA